VTSTWIFDNDGGLTLPGSIYKDGPLYLNSSGTQNSASVVNDGPYGRVFLRTFIDSTQNSWYFNGNGTTQFPDDTILSPYNRSLNISTMNRWNICKLLTGGSGYGNGGSSSVVSGGSGTGMVVGYGYGLSGQVTNVGVTNPGTGYQNGDVLTMDAGDGTATFEITEYNENPSADSTSIWEFSTDGNLTLPGNTFAINYANGTQVQLGGGSSYGDSNVITLLSDLNGNSISNVGSISFSNGITIQNNEITANTDNRLYLNGFNNPEGDGNDIRIYAGDAGSTTGDSYVGGDIRLYAGSGTNGVTGGDIRLRTYDSNDNSHTWYFEPEGTLDIPDQYAPINRSYNGLVFNYGQATISFVLEASGNFSNVTCPNGGGGYSASSGQIIMPGNQLLGGTSPENDITWAYYCAANDGVITSFNYSSGTPPTYRNAIQSGLDIGISANNNNWVFDATGELTLPTGGHLGATKGGTMLDAGAGYNLSLTALYSSGNYAACVNPNSDGNINLNIWGDGTGLTGSWIFDNTGNLHMPAMANTQQRISGTTTTILSNPAPAQNDYLNPTANVVVWTADSDQVIGAKMILRAQFVDAQGIIGGYRNMEMMDIMIAKNYPDGTPVYNVSNRIKTSDDYSNLNIFVELNGSNCIQVLSNSPDGTGNGISYTYSLTAFNN
jgi:hypothetical protein